MVRKWKWFSRKLGESQRVSENLGESQRISWKGEDAHGRKNNEARGEVGRMGREGENLPIQRNDSQRITRPVGKLKEAVTYAQNQKEYLCAFLDHGEIEISNNQVENAIRPFVVGRKGWLFSDTPDGAEATAVFYSLMETAKANRLHLEDYIQYLLTVLPVRLAADPKADIDDLLPWADGIRQLFGTGD